ncbi:MAG: FRG domain-containing protein [Verrucomicrobiales bacterium]|nr:FRG domain-containing protein [Verrucomicrobiales bacterium]
MREIETTEIHTVQAFVEEIVPNLGFQRQPVYRGQADIGWRLVPSLLRESIGQSEFKNWDDLECALAFQFKQQAGQPFLGGETPGTELEWRAIGQHFGLPTRFTSWTENALVALFFATENRRDESDGVVWRILPGDRDLILTQDFEQVPDRPQLYFPKHGHPEILAQKTCFLSHVLPEFDTPAISFEDHYESCSEDRLHLCQIVIPHEFKSSIRHHLRGMGIDHRTLFPGLRGLCGSIREKIYAHTDSYEWVFAA